MNSQIHSAIIRAFEDLLNPVAWKDMSDAFKQANYQNVYVRHINFETNSLIEMRTCLTFDDHEQLEMFLNKEHKLAMETQKFDWAAIIHEKQKNLKNDDKSFDGVYLKYSIQDISSGVCDLLFETNVLSFRYSLIEEFASYAPKKKEFEFYEFTEIWNEYINGIIKNDDLNVLWNSSNGWTSKVLSEDLIKKLSEEFNFNKQVWKEWKKFDLIVGTDDHFEDVYGYDLDKTFEEYFQITKKKGFLEYPKHQLLLLEHENDFRTALNELIKLTYERAKFKVLITYPEKLKHRLALISNTLNILDQSDKCNPEYSTEYILVLGEVIQNTIYWSFYQFGCNGVLLNSHYFTNTGIYETIKELTSKDFERHPIWHDFKTVKINNVKNSISWVDSVKPVKDKDDVVIHTTEKFPSEYYSESYYVSCKFLKGEIEYMGYVHLSTDYYPPQDGEYEIYFEPVIIDKNTETHIPLTIDSKYRRQFLIEHLNMSPEELFPLKYEIQAKLDGFNKCGVIKG
jgi:hypothetical protein